MNNVIKCFIYNSHISDRRSSLGNDQEILKILKSEGFNVVGKDNLNLKIVGDVNWWYDSSLKGTYYTQVVEEKLNDKLF